jgi:hypothetical protein
MMKLLSVGQAAPQPFFACYCLASVPPPGGLPNYVENGHVWCCCRNTPLLTGVTSTADELTSFVYSALLLGCGVSVAEDNRGI